ncbi:MAG: (Fe-S)-binding protein [Deltaproteobacteria bacterium]|nr:(Fe-S)-binding protein [Deltaproteobacteria bacterium]
METVEPFEEAIDLIKDAGGDAFKLCFQCGLCTASCPWNAVRTFMPHRLICESRYGLVDLEDESWWQCTTCNQCVDRCPRGVAITDILGSVRKILLDFEYRMAPASLRSAMGGLSGEGNPWGGERNNRSDWIKDTGIKKLSETDEALYFSCCTPAYDTRLGNVARATGRILQKAGIGFGTLGSKESCCGESVRKVGNTDVFETLAKSNIKAFQENGVKEIIATSPHCYTTFKNDYPELGGVFEVSHVTQVLDRLISQGKIEFTKEVNKKVVYHDPCYLGRHNGIYDEPRNVLRSIPGLQWVDELNARENSLCCGGGGGRIWMETVKGERFSDILVTQAVEQGADILATACPYCILNFKDSVATAEMDGELEIMDVSELVEMAM